MPGTPPSHGAVYDEFGNIILIETSQENPPVRSQEPNAPAFTRHGEWTLIEEIDTGRREIRSAIRRLPSVQSALSEGTSQMRYTARSLRTGAIEALTGLKTLPARTRGILTRAWTFANTPCQAPWLRRKPKPRSRLYLFSVDVVRFGGTFAMIFALLFVAINYQSFWQITKAQLALGTDLATEQNLSNIVRPASTEVAMAGTPPTSRFGAPQGRLIDYLSRVGPYENRLIVPKLGKNVPIVRPSMDALMRQAWKEFEDDVQSALRYGVVHYPGSAVPGQAGNFFITGHSSYYPWDDGGFKDVFVRLGDLEPGDTYSVYYGGDLHTYRVTKKYQVKPSDVSVLDQPSNKRLATLMTCTPTGTTLFRLIVQAEEIDPLSGIALTIGQKNIAKQDHKLRLETLPI